ncbi:Phosphodiest-domain-containing protein [Xylona heveae TC161]|uniref:Phosphodiest-domain-containing protein n=1 Tax=Xylona heveae (strain CBS 132557 / TC161) TaxID=1328760 RepID=A0A165HLB9_XYLHT|nr:Phosphodiest-domain-containing protein [Xylona heveae TC161]KZF23688.1 Phosphodiest-domain-containing protein [Xylona heveae TC161]
MAAGSQGHQFLSPRIHDEDVLSVRSLSDRESDSEDDNVLSAARDSGDIARHDRSVLEEEEERERLLTGGSSAGAGFRRMFSGGNQGPERVRIGKSERKRQKRRDRRAARRPGKGKHGTRELMFELEEGGLRTDTGSDISGASSSEIDRRRLRSVYKERPRRTRRTTLLIFHAAAVVLFLIFLLFAYKLSSGRKMISTTTLRSNGTSLFAPTTILISLDGFRADFLNRGLTPTLNSFIETGISPRYMLPSFPSVTFPNHFTLVTGLYPESHGVVGNTFWDKDIQQQFSSVHPERSMQPKWWQGEPLWLTAEKQGIRSAIHMWPGSEAHIGGVDPAFLDKYNGSEALSRKVSRVLGFLDLPGEQDPKGITDEIRPQFIAAYVPIVDRDGHKYGPNSTEIRGTISHVDDMLHDLFVGLEERNLTNIVNVVVVSDHGMATTSTDRLIQLEDLVDPDLLEHIDGWPLYGLRPKDPHDLEKLYNEISEKAAEYPNIDVYLRDRNMPERYHFSNNDRIAPLWIVPKTGWAIVTKAEMDVEKAKANGEVFHPMGLHGYDHEHPLMRAIFVAKGPSFPHKPNSRLDVFQNTEVYNIICDSLGLTPQPNNGTLRLPLKPVGLHSDDDATGLDSPDDPPASSATLGFDSGLASHLNTLFSSMSVTVSPSHLNAVSKTESSATEPTTAASIGVDTPEILPPRPTIVDENDDSQNNALPSPPTPDDNAQGHDAADKEKEEDRIQKWWAYVVAKLHGAKDWAGNLFDGNRSNSTSTSATAVPSLAA